MTLTRGVITATFPSRDKKQIPLTNWFCWRLCHLSASCFFWNLGSRKSLESYDPLGRRVSVDHGFRPGIFMIFPATLISGHPWGGISSPFPIFTGTIFGEILRNGFTASKKSDKNRMLESFTKRSYMFPSSFAFQQGTTNQNLGSIERKKGSNYERRLASNNELDLLLLVSCANHKALKPHRPAR